MARLHLKSTNARAVVRAAIRTAAQQRTVRGSEPQADASSVSFDDTLSALDATEVAEKVEVTLPHQVVYLYDVTKEGKRYNQRFYAPGLLMKDSSGVLHDVYFEVNPRFKPGFIVDPTSYSDGNRAGTLVVSAVKGVAVFKHQLVKPENPAKSPVKRTFVVTPDFVSFNGKPAVPENPEDAAEEAAVDAE